MEELYYINSQNQKIDFTKFPYLVKDIGEILDFTNDYRIEGNELIFEDGATEISVVLNVSADTPQAYRKAVDHFYNVTQTDVLNGTMGKLYYDDQYVECNVVGSTKKDWCMGVCYMMNYIRFVTTRPYWITEVEHNFPSFQVVSSNNKNYPDRYRHRYANGMSNTYITNENFCDSNFKITVEGPTINPQITIGRQTYLVNIVLEKGEHLEIDSRTQMVEKVKLYGEREDAFHNRDKGGMFFKKIPPGNQDIIWTGKFEFSLIIYSERKEPRI